MVYARLDVKNVDFVELIFLNPDACAALREVVHPWHNITRPEAHGHAVLADFYRLLFACLRHEYAFFLIGVRYVQSIPQDLILLLQHVVLFCYDLIQLSVGLPPLQAVPNYVVGLLDLVMEVLVDAFDLSDELLDLAVLSLDHSLVLPGGNVVPKSDSLHLVFAVVLQHD